MRPPSIPRWALFAPFLGLVLLGLCSCDPTVDIYQPSDENQYSLFGTLNVTADTQAIRVEPIQDTAQVGAPSSINGTVVLENLDSGSEVTLQDSVVQIRSNTFHTFWTTHPIQAETSYRVSVERDGEIVTEATTQTPAQPPELNVRRAIALPCMDDSSRNKAVVSVQNTEQVAAVQAHYFPMPDDDPGGSSASQVTFNHYSGLDQDEESFLVSLFYRSNLEALNESPGCASPQDLVFPFALLEVTAGGPDWPDWLRQPLNEVARPDTFSNVTGGHGYVGGTFSNSVRVSIYVSPSRY